MIILTGSRAKRESANHVIMLRSKLNGLLLSTILLPFIVWGLFHFHVIVPKEKDYILPVAKVLTPFGTGSAFLVGETRLLTANHVVDKMSLGDKVDIVFEKSHPVIFTQARILFKSEEISADFEIDFAVLELTNPGVIPEKFPRIPCGNSDEITLSDEIIIIGYPGGLFSVTEGRISNNKVEKMDLFQLDAGAWSGSSGGPVINKKTKEVIGILVAGLEGPFKGINMGCKMKNVLTILKQKGIDINK